MKRVDVHPPFKMFARDCDREKTYLSISSSYSLGNFGFKENRLFPFPHVVQASTTHVA